MSEDLKHTCHECGGRIGYPSDSFGTTIHCPHCGRQTTLGEIYPDAPEIPNSVQTKRLPPTQTPAFQEPLAELSQPTRQTNHTVTIIAVGSVLAITMVVLFVLSGRRAEAAREAAVAAERQAKEEAAKTAAVEAAKREAEAARQKLENEEKAKAVAKAAADAKAEAIAQAAAQAAVAAKMELERKAKAEADKMAKLKSNPTLFALWEEPDQDAIRINSTTETDAFIRHKGKTLSVKYSDMPEWLRTKAQSMHKDDGEARGFYREIRGKIYDLRTNPPGWVTIPTAKVLQVFGDGYLMINEGTTERFRVAVFKLKHNGLSRVLNENDRIQVTGFSDGTYTYETKGGDTKTVPVYDPGMPVGPLREKVVPFRN
jgi:DNA-directed RNA polymerase subunit RPC12/RpoP